MTVYFIDYENVGSQSLTGISKIGSDDKVYLFYTVNAGKLDFSQFKELASIQSKLELMSVSTGKNALDFQLCTFLGSISSKYPKAELVIVSRDTGYDAVISFWKGRSVKIHRVYNMNLQGVADLETAISAAMPELTKDVNEILSMLGQYKTKQGLNSALCKKYGNDKTSKLLKIIKPGK